MRFGYLALPVRKPAPTLRGATARYRPIVPIHIISPVTTPPVDACIDCAADDTVLPPHLAQRLGVNLGATPAGQARAVGGAVVPVYYAPVTLLLSDGMETCEWDTIVGFSAVTMRWALLGHAGFLEFFDIQLLGARREAIVVPNTAFPGKHVVHTTQGP